MISAFKIKENVTNEIYLLTFPKELPFGTSQNRIEDQ